MGSLRRDSIIAVGRSISTIVTSAILLAVFFFFSSRRRHTRYWRDWSSDVCSSDLDGGGRQADERLLHRLVAHHRLDRPLTVTEHLRRVHLSPQALVFGAERADPG